MTTATSSDEGTRCKVSFTPSGTYLKRRATSFSQLADTLHTTVSLFRRLPLRCEATCRLYARPLGPRNQKPLIALLPRPRMLLRTLRWIEHTYAQGHFDGTQVFDRGRNDFFVKLLRRFARNEEYEPCVAFCERFVNWSAQDLVQISVRPRMFCRSMLYHIKKKIYKENIMTHLLLLHIT